MEQTPIWLDLAEESGKSASDDDAPFICPRCGEEWHDDDGCRDPQCPDLGDMTR